MAHPKGNHLEWQREAARSLFDLGSEAELRSLPSRTCYYFGWLFIQDQEEEEKPQS